MDFRLMHRHAVAGVGRVMLTFMRVAMIVVMPMIVSAHMGVPAVGTGLWLERCHPFGRMRTEAREHVRENMVGANAQAIVPILLAPDDLQRRMAIAEVVGAACKCIGIVALDLEHGFGGSGDAHDTPIVGFEAITAAQHSAAFQKKSDLFAG